MMWTKQSEFTYRKGKFTIHYDNASEFGKAVAEIRHFHNYSIGNPYDPSHLEYDEFNEARNDRMTELKGKS